MPLSHFESEENRSEMIGWVMSTFHLLHIIDILTPQINQARIARLGPEGAATFGDVLLKPEELPVACQEQAKTAFAIRGMHPQVFHYSCFDLIIIFIVV